ncbi:hypothetical protein CPC08DRAFT_635186 [Agrocybe pediades]|nr:hypothetical protein CPC08DRAFT_635186 [Agrocybe pediades]
MTAPSHNSKESIVHWNKLRILRLPPHDRESMEYLPRILSLSYLSLEELYLDHIYTKERVQLPLAQLVNLSNLPELRRFTLSAVLGAYDVVTDISTILERVPASNKMTNIMIGFEVSDASIMRFDHRWHQLYGRVERIASQKKLEFELKFFPSSHTTPVKEVDMQGLKLLGNLTSLITSQSTICLHIWTPICWTLGIPPMVSGTYREQCK